MTGTAAARSPEYLAFSGVTIDLAVRVPHVPQPGERIGMVPLGEYAGGMAGNAASAFAMLGGAAGVVSTVGDDVRGRIAVDDLRARGVGTTWICTVGEPTLWTIALLTPEGDRTLLEFPVPVPEAKYKRFPAVALEGVRFIHVGASEGASALPVMEQARRHGATVALDLESLGVEIAAIPKMLAASDVVFVNARAIRAFGDDVLTAVERLHGLGPSTVLATGGATGCTLRAQDGRISRIPAHAVTPVDTTGAGDCFAGAFAFGRTRGWPDEESAQLANLMAAISTTAMGSRGHLATQEELGVLARDAGLAVSRRLP